MCIARVGKTSLSLRFAQNQFDEHQQSTMDATCLTPTVEISGGKQQQIAIWDTAGQERYHCLNPVYYRNSEGKSRFATLIRCVGAVIVYDITDETSFTKVTMWITELKKYVETDIPIIIAANKSDLKNRVIN